MNLDLRNQDGHCPECGADCRAVTPPGQIPGDHADYYCMPCDIEAVGH